MLFSIWTPSASEKGWNLLLFNVIYKYTHTHIQRYLLYSTSKYNNIYINWYAGHPILADTLSNFSRKRNKDNNIRNCSTKVTLNYLYGHCDDVRFSRRRDENMVRNGKTNIFKTLQCNVYAYVLFIMYQGRKKFS